MMIVSTHYDQLTTENTRITLQQLKAQVLKGEQ